MQTSIEQTPTLYCSTCSAHFDDERANSNCPHDDTPLEQLQWGRLSGTVIAQRYQLEQLIGVGGWSEVYRAADLQLGRTVAVKILHLHLGEIKESLLRFETEAAAAASIAHTHVATIFDYGYAENDRPFMVMELVQGQSLKEILKHTERLPWQRALPLFLQICDALNAAHAAGIIHRDIKPGNILVAGPGNDTVKIVDFGLAKITHEDNQRSLTQTGETIGTPSYMSPEQCMGGHVDFRTDIYSLGCVMYETIVGKRPFLGASTFDLMLQQVNSFPAGFLEINLAGELPEDLESIIFRCISKNPEHRYERWELLRDDLNAVLNGRPIANGTSSVRANKLFSHLSRKSTNLFRCVPTPIYKALRAFAYACLSITISLAVKSAYGYVAGPTGIHVISQAMPLSSLADFYDKNGVYQVVRPPGLALVANRNSNESTLESIRMTARALRIETQSDGFTGCYFTGTLDSLNGPVSFEAFDKIDPEKNLSYSSIVYSGNLSARFFACDGKEVTINHIHKVETIHRDDGWLHSQVECMDGNRYQFLSKPDGTVRGFGVISPGNSGS